MVHCWEFGLDSNWEVKRDLHWVYDLVSNWEAKKELNWALDLDLC